MRHGTHLHRILSWIHLEMKIFLFICLASGLAFSDKLDRSYLPPPGSKFSGGSPGDIQLPLEFPKETYTTVQPQDSKPDIEFGINQRPPPSFGVSDSQINHFRNSYTVPKTTTSYAITQTTTFAPAGDYEGLDQTTGFNNVSTGIQSRFPGLSNQEQPLRGPAQLPSFNQYRQGQNEPSTIAPYGTTARPLFPGIQKGLEYLPPSPSSNGSGQSPGQDISSQDSFGYQSGQPQGPEYPNGSSPFPGKTNVNLPSLAPGSNQRTQYTGSQNIPSSVAPQYKDGGFGSTGPGFQQTQNQFPGGVQLPSSIAVPQYQYGQRFSTPEINKEEQFSMNQNVPFSTALPTPGFNQQRVPTTLAPQYENGQRFTTPGQLQGFVPGEIKQNQYVGNQNLASSTAVPQFQDGNRVASPGYVQQGIASSVTPIQNQYQGNPNLPFSTAAPQYQNGQQFTTPGLVRENQYLGNQKFQSTPSPTYQERQRFSTPSQLVSGQQSFGSRMPNQQSQNQYGGNENFPSSTVPALNQAGQRFSTSIPQTPNQQSENQYAENQNNYPSSTPTPQYQDGQGFTTSRFQTPNQQNQNQYSDNQNYPFSTTAPQYQDSQRFITPGSQIPNQQIQNQYSSDQNFPTSTVAPQRFTTSGSQTPNRQSQNQYSENRNYPSSTIAPQYPGGQRFATPGSQIPYQQTASQQRFEFTQQNQYPGSQSFPSSTAVPHFQDQRFSNSGQHSMSNQQTYPGSTTAPQYQQTFAPSPGISQPEFISGQQNQYQQPTYNQQIPSSTGMPQVLFTESQAYGKDGTQSTPEAAVLFPAAQGGFSGTQISMYGNTQQPASATGAGSLIYSTTPSGVSEILNQGFPSTTVRLPPPRDFSTMPGFGNIVQRRPDRPQTENERNASILNYENVLTPEGYSYSYDTSNGIHADETGTVGNGTRAQGGFSYTGDDGKVYSVFYSADENGFQPQGDHLPTSPPIPEAIQRVIDQAIKDKESGIEDDGSYDDEKYGYIKYEGPLTRHPRPQKKTMSTVNGVDLPDVNKNRVGGQKNKVLQPKGSHSNADSYSEADASAKFEPESETEIGETEINENEREGEYHPNDNVGRISTKRPKPIKNLTVEDNRRNHFRGNKMPIKISMGSKFNLMQNKKPFDTNSQTNLSASPEKDDDIVRDDVSIFDVTDEGNEDVGSATDGAQEYDNESDLVNYKDDPNNRTNFHGLNKYLPNTKGINRKNQSGKGRPTVKEGDSHKDMGVNKSGEPENESDFIDETRTRIPTRKNNIGKKIKGQTRVAEQPSFDNGDKTNNYDDSSIVTEDNDFDEDAGPLSDKPGALQSKNKTFGKAKRPIFNNRRVVGENINIKPSPNDETGYEYTPPQRKFETGGKLGFPSERPVSGKPTFIPKGSQTTLRPFMTKNVYGDETETAKNEGVDQPNAVKPDRRERPTAAQMQQYPGLKQDVDSFAKPQTSTTPQYESEGVTDQIRYNEPINTQGSQTSGDKVFYNTNTPNSGTSGNVFSSTTLLPPSGPNSISQYQRPGQYQGRPTDASESYDETSSPGKTYINRPGTNESVSSQVPSTTFRPNYSAGDRTLAPSGLFSVDGFGRPIPSTNGPVFDKTLRPTYSTARPSTAESHKRDKFKSTVGRFGVTSSPTQGTPGYQSSTSGPIGEDFSGPKQPQRFDSQSGYYYK